MTCNSNWKVNKKDFLPNQNPKDKPDILVTVSKKKLDVLMIGVFKGHLLSSVAAYLYIVEFQKRGLPHVHILLILAENDKLTTDEQVMLQLDFWFLKIFKLHLEYEYPLLGGSVL